MISVIIPTYKEPEALDLCLESCIKGQTFTNEIIVVVDGFYEVNKPILEKYQDNIKVLDLGENMGLAKATNFGVYSATEKYVLVVNDDNVFSDGWDYAIARYYPQLNNDAVISINQIEPKPSMFRQFKIEDLGTTIEDFNLDDFWIYVKRISGIKVDGTGSTLPFIMKKENFIKIGGWDTDYPGATVVDWDFFLKCNLNNYKMLRIYDTHFYHFVSLGTNLEPQKRNLDEQNGHEYFKFKWGSYANHNPNNNLKSLK